MSVRLGRVTVYTCTTLLMSQVPGLVEKYMNGGTRLDDYITHRMKFQQVGRENCTLSVGLPLARGISVAKAVAV